MKLRDLFTPRWRREELRQAREFEERMSRSIQRGFTLKELRNHADVPAVTLKDLHRLAAGAPNVEINLAGDGGVMTFTHPDGTVQHVRSGQWGKIPR